MGLRSKHILPLVLTANLFAAPLVAQARQSMADPVSRPSSASVPGILFSPDHSKLLLMERTTPAADGAAGRSYSALVVQPIGRGETRRIILPWKARVRSVFWAPDGNRVGFTIFENQGVSVWVGDAYSGVIRMLAGPVLDAAKDEPCQWFHSGEQLLCSRTPFRVAGSPAPRERDHAGQLVVYSVSGPERAIGAPAVHGDVSISPDGRYMVVETIDRPDAVRTEVWDASNGAVVRVVRSAGTRERRHGSSDAVAPGPRSIEWRGDKPATLVWVEAQDGGSSAGAARIRDRLFQLASPFDGVPAPFANLEFRSRGVVWGGDDLAVVSEGWSEPRRTRSWIVQPDRGGAPRLLQGSTGKGAVTGSFLTRRKGNGEEVLVTAQQGRVAYLLGALEGTAGDRSYLDQIDLATGRTQRLWQSQTPFREELMGVIDADEGRIIVRRESAAEPENYFVRDLRKKQVSALTNFK